MKFYVSSISKCETKKLDALLLLTSNNDKFNHLIILLSTVYVYCLLFPKEYLTSTCLPKF